jgi:methionyl aminopeptidase
MIPIKSPSEIEAMRYAGSILAHTLQEVAQAVRPGLHTSDLDQLAEASLLKQGARPAFKGYRGYPSALCISINEEVVHGIPGPRLLQEGDLVSLDLGAVVGHFFSDSTVTVAVGQVSAALRELLRVGKSSLAAGIKMARAGKHLGDISLAIQEEAERNGYSVVRDFVGHGIGRQLHEEPQVPNFGYPGTGILLKEGMVLAIEPMVNLGEAQVEILRNGWTVVTNDRRPSVHFEHTVLVTAQDPEILTEWK